MQHSFFQAICRVGIFMICAQAIVHFRPQETYEKYLKLLVGIMTLIQLILPIGSFFAGGGRQQAEEALEQFGREMEESVKAAEKNAVLADQLLQQMTLEEVLRQAENGRNGTGTQTENGGSGTGAQTENGGNETEAQIKVRIESEVENVEPVRIEREG